MANDREAEIINEPYDWSSLYISNVISFHIVCIFK